MPLNAQLLKEHGLTLGASYFDLDSKMRINPNPPSGYPNVYKDNICSPLFGLHLGYYFKLDLKNRFSTDLEALYGFRTVNDFSFPYDMSEGWSSRIVTNPNLHYVSISAVFNYEPIDKLTVGIGPEPTYYFSSNDDFKRLNSVDNMFDVMGVAKLAYDFGGFTLSLAYKHGFVSIFESETVESTKARDLQLMFTIPIRKKKK